MNAKLKDKYFTEWIMKSPKEGWALKNWCFWTLLLEKTLESPLDCKEIRAVNPEGNQSWIFIGRIDADAEAPILVATWYKLLTHWKRPWCWERSKAEGEQGDRGWDGWMASPTQWTGIWATLGDSGGQRSLGGYRAWGQKELDTI